MIMKCKRWICLAWLALIPFAGNAVTPMIAAGTDASLFLNSDGTVWGTGEINPYFPGATSPVSLLQLPGVIAVATMGYSSDFALLADGTVWAAGVNTNGQLGDGTTQNRPQPQRVPGLSGVKAIAASTYAHVLALKDDGSVWAWGRNNHGQLGDGTQTDRYSPVQVRGLSSVTKISAGDGASLAVRDDGTVWVWGFTCCGAAGNGISPSGASDPEWNHLVPTQVHTPDRMTAVAAGSNHNMALSADGTVWSWGRGDLGQNGTGPTGLTPNPQSLPVQVPGLDNVMAIATSGAHASFALKADGTVWAWGNNNNGQLGQSGITYSASPIQVAGLSDIVAIAPGSNHVLVLKRDGTVFAWGSNGNGQFSTGQLGDNTLQDRAQPLPVVGPGGSGQLNLLQPAPSTYNQLPSARIDPSVASGHAPLTVQVTVVNATDPDGTITSYTWKSSDGQQGTGASASFVYRHAGTYGIDLLIEDNTGARGHAAQFVVVAPAVTSVLAAAAKIGMGAWNSVALANDGRVLIWGAGWNLGLYDSQVLHSRPDANSLPVANGVTGAADIEIGGEQLHVLLTDGTVMGWGGNPNGQVGTGNASNAWQPQVLLNLPPVNALADGHTHSLALTKDGRVFAWGGNTSGELGLGDYENRYQPTEIAGLSNVVAIAAGFSFSVALKADGTVWTWGDNSCCSQLGDGTRISRNRPAQVTGLDNVTKIFATYFAFYAQKADGTVWAAGYVPLSSPFDTPGPGPQHIPALDNAVQIAGGAQHIIARKADGTVSTAGSQLSSLALGFQDGGAVPVLTQIPGVTDAIRVAAGQAGAMVLRRDGTVLSWGLNNYGQIGDGTLALQQTPVLVMNETADGFLDLIPEIANTIPQDKIPPFFLATYANGGLSSTTLYADVKGLTPGGAFASGDPGRFAAGYNVYVAASVPSLAGSPYFQLGSNNAWSTLSWPMAQFMSGVALDSQNNIVRAQVLQNADLSSPLFAGTSVLVGYGTDPDEMVRTGRYRTIFTVTQP